MTAHAALRPGGLSVRWRTFEVVAVMVALAIQSGAVTVLAFTGWDGELTAAGRTILQLIVLPVYILTLVLLARRPAQLLTAVQRNIPFALMLALPFLSALWSITPSVTVRRAVGLLLSVLLAYVLALRFTPRQFLVLLVLLLGPLMVLSLAFAVALPDWAYMPDEHILRGVFNHKNVLGWNAALATICSAALALDRPSGLTLPAMLVLAASVACLLLSASATSLVIAGSAIPFALFFAALARQRGAGRVVLILAGVQILALVLLAGDAALGVLLDGTDKDASFTGRVPLWNLVDQSIGRRLLLGYGYQAFWTEGNGEAWAIWARVDWMAPHAHSGYRDTLLSFGVVGATLFAVVILQAIRAGAILHRRHPEEPWAWLNIWICAFLVMNLTESAFLWQNNMLYITFATAILMVTLRARDGADRPPR